MVAVVFAAQVPRLNPLSQVHFSGRNIWSATGERRRVWSLWHLMLGSTRRMVVIWRQYRINALYYKVILSTARHDQI
jgi:hypothetical protein